MRKLANVLQTICRPCSSFERDRGAGSSDFAAGQCAESVSENVRAAIRTLIRTLMVTGHTLKIS